MDIGVVTMSDKTSPSLLRNNLLGVKVEGDFNGGDYLY